MSQNQKKMWRCPVCGTDSELHVAKCPSCHTDLPIKGILITVDEAETENKRQRQEQEAARREAVEREKREIKERRLREAEERQRREQAAAEEKRQDAQREKQAKAAAKQEKKEDTTGASQKKNWLPAVLGVCVVVVLCVFLLPGLMESGDDDRESDAYLYHTQGSTEGMPVEDSTKDEQETGGASVTEAENVETTAEVPSEMVEEERWSGNRLSKDYHSDKSHDYEVTPEDPVYGSKYQRQEILAVVFTDTLAQKNETAFRVSGKLSGEVLAWVEPNGSGYTLYIGAEGGINASGDACESLFLQYINLESISFNGAFHTDYSTNMKWMFYGCKSLTTLDVSDFNTSNVEKMNGMFYECESLTKVDVSGFDTSSVTHMGGMFLHCKSLTTLDVSNFDTSDVTEMMNMFRGCESLTTLDVSGFDTSNVMYIEGMFEGCSGLQSLGVDELYVPDGAIDYDMYKGTIWE